MERLPSITAKNELASKVFVVDFDQKQVVVNARFRPKAASQPPGKSGMIHPMQRRHSRLKFQRQVPT
jgi:hypothetical protein